MVALSCVVEVGFGDEEDHNDEELSERKEVRRVDKTKGYQSQVEHTPVKMNSVAIKGLHFVGW